jgi:hypothetical protein
MTNRELVSLLALCSMSALSAQYHVDSRAGDDNNPGTARAKPWRSLGKVNEAILQPGDRVLFRAGSSWSEQLLIRAQGAPGLPVRFQAEGSGPRPRIDTGGRFQDAVVLSNAQHVVFRDFELTNTEASWPATGESRPPAGIRSCSGKRRPVGTCRQQSSARRIQPRSPR